MYFLLCHFVLHVPSFVFLPSLVDESVVANNANRKTKTFSEILNEKARSGGRIGYNLHRYADVDLEEQLSKRINQKGWGLVRSFLNSRCHWCIMDSDSQINDQVEQKCCYARLNRILTCGLYGNRVDDNFSAT